MRAYIKGLYTISPPYTTERSFGVTSLPGYRIAAEPDYRPYIDPKLSRRMARIIKMGVAAAQGSLAEAGAEKPGAIIVGTGLGCLQDTEKFLADVTENHEGLLSPTAFIQSTHNTIAGQIALVLQCARHNFTFVQRGHSFENALEDALLQVGDGVDDVLAGGIDEMTPTVYALLKKMGCADEAPGEGATFFVLSGRPSAKAQAAIEGMWTFPGLISAGAVMEEATAFLHQTGISPADIDAVVMGFNGSPSGDAFYDALSARLFKGKPVVQFKNLCGEYFTASAFGHYLSARILLDQNIPPAARRSGPLCKKIQHVLFYNHSRERYHTLTLFSTCRHL